MNYKIVVLGIIILFTVGLITSLSLRGCRQFLKKVHACKDDEYSWTRYIGSFITIVCVYVILAQLYVDGSVNETLILGMLGIAITGKVAQRSFSENGGTNKKHVPDEERV